MVKKDCYGILDKVFPVGNNELREITPECFHCHERTSCLKSALCTEQGLKMRGEILDRAATSGVIGRLQMWSQKKELSRLMKKEKDK